MGLSLAYQRYKNHKTLFLTLLQSVNLSKTFYLLIKGVTIHTTQISCMYYNENGLVDMSISVSKINNCIYSNT